MEDLILAARQLAPELVQLRRKLHSFAEVGTQLPRTCQLVRQTLEELGYEPRELCPGGLVAQLQGKPGGKTILLRADMDALRLPEKSGLSFAATNGCMHACGHDMHTAMLLGAARLLMERKDAIRGNIRLVFPPDEEGFTGAKSTVKAGVLEQVDAAMALHVNSGTPSGLVLAGRGVTMAGCRFFRIIVRGTGCHGAMPDTGVDPINIAAHIYLALQEIIAREIPPQTPAILTLGKFQAGQAPNIIPQEAVLEGSIRTMDMQLGEFIYDRLCQMATQTAALFRGEAQVEELCSVPPLNNNEALVEQMADYIRRIHPKEKLVLFRQGGMGSEDFSVISQKVPCCYLLLGAGTAREDPAFGKPMHNEAVVFNEEVLPLGAAILAQCALRWLEEA